MTVFLTTNFKRAVKKLHRNQITVLEDAIKAIESNPIVGELKIGDLAGVRVYKFHILHQLILLAYTYKEQNDEIILLYFAPHQNFYDTLKQQVI